MGLIQTESETAMRIVPYSLQGRFLAGMLAIMLVVGGLFAVVLRSHMRDLFLSEARAKAGIMAAHTEAIQAYVRNVLRPAVSSALGNPDEFVIEAMSTSFVTRHILDALSLEDNDFTYRRVAKNARNPDYEATEDEKRFLHQLEADPSLHHMERLVTTKGREYLTVIRPVRFSADCMRCHGEPENAPAILLQMYGDTRGFHRRADEPAGLDIISVPTESHRGAIVQSISMFVIFFGSCMALLLLSMQTFFNRLVVHNLRRVGAILQSSFPQDHGGNAARLEQEEEIEGMVRSIEVVAGHLGEARRQLGEYAKNLEGMVEERTADLERVLHERSADVQLFVRLLGGLNSNGEKSALLRSGLELIAVHFHARRAIYACGLADTDFQSWPPEEGGARAGIPPEEKERLHQTLRNNEPMLLPGTWYIPVQTSGQARGVLGLYWNDASGPAGKAPAPEAPPTGPDDARYPLALAFGRQLGIALDNLDALDALLRQHSLLDSLVEGIAEPLILTERGNIPLLANQAARRLAATLAPEPPAGPEDTADLTALLDSLEVGRDLPGSRAAAQHEVELEDGRSFAVGIHPMQAVYAGDTRSVVHVRETTAERRMLTHLRRNEKLAAVGQLSAGLAHEINNPLGVIRCYAELLKKSSAGGQAQADLDVILRHVEQARTVLRDLLNFSRPHVASPAPCDMAGLLGPLLDILRPQVRSAGIEVELEIPAPLPTLRVDGGMLGQVVMNLLLNAVDAVKESGRENGRIVLRAEREPSGGGLRISVRDNGTGLKEEDIPRIFDPFFTTKAPGAGTGLGLAIAFGMVRDMGGRLDVSPAPRPDGETGAVFTITLPLKPVEDSRDDPTKHTGG